MPPNWEGRLLSVNVIRGQTQTVTIISIDAVAKQRGYLRVGD
jgi:hypothetical protein